MFRLSMVLVVLGCSFTHAHAQAGPDVTIGDITGTVRWATDAVETAYSVGATWCNAGDAPVTTIDPPSNQHPVFGSNLYRLSADGRFEQIGQSWLRHEFCGVQFASDFCGVCDTAPGCFEEVRPGCSDPYTAGRGGSQIGLGPKWEVNAFTGEFPVPWGTGEGVEGDFRRRLRVRTSDVDPGANLGAQYFVEVQAVAADDSASGNQANNVSSRQVGVECTFDLTMTGDTYVGQPAIRVWRDVDPSVTLVDVPVPGDGSFIVGYAVTDRGDGTWQYEYAVYNLYSHRSGQAFRVVYGAGARISGVDFHDVDYHSGEAWSSDDWDSIDDGDAVTWFTETFAADEFANALRWGTMYGFRFQADTPPASGMGRLELFRPGTPDGIDIPILVPSAYPCPSDIDRSGDVGFTDFLLVASTWGPCPPRGSCVADIDGGGDVGFTDMLQVFSDWGPCDVPGACCLPDASCAQRTADACADAGGAFEGVGVSCVTSACPRDGACCLADETCVEVSQVACDVQGGGYAGDDTSCFATTCATAGACCFPDGSCTANPQTACECLGGVFQGVQTSCVDPCPAPGACCLADGDCVQMPIVGGAVCASLGGVYLGDDTVCGVDACPQPGACCLPDGTCVQSMFAGGHDCTIIDGDYVGDDTTCADAECVFGACCLADGTCVEVASHICALYPGVFQGDGAECASVECAAPGACCLPDGGCMVLPPAVCDDSGGSFPGDAACSFVDCSRGACCFDDGTCAFIAETTCAIAGGEYVGDGVVCGAVSCE